MRKIYKNYFVLSLLLILIGFIAGNCGGGDDTGAVPDVSGNPGSTQNLVSKDVSGFVYATSPLSVSKDEGEEETLFSILDIPINGEDGFISQVNEYIQEDTSSKGTSPETEELLAAFTEEAGQYQPLPVWNSAAHIYSSYADSFSTSPVPITSEGEISGSVLVDAADDLVSLDIEVSGEECYATEAISSSDLLNSSDASGEYVLKSCPGKIIIKPGDCKIFEVFSKPSVNLFDAGLQFSLVNPELGTICGPIFLRCNGSKKYSVAYGLFYAKKNVSTPVDTAINVSTSQGKSLILPVQIVKKTAVVSGKVYASGPIVKGFVISQGPKSQCKINADGTYSLPKVWQGTGRKITATWWIMNGDKKVRYRETKYVDVFGDVTVDFGVMPTPTVPPLRPITDHYYTEKAMQIMMQRDTWAENLGMEQAVQRTIQWLNGELELSFTVVTPDGTAEITVLRPPPEGIAGAVCDDYDPTTMWIEFTDGRSRCISSHPIIEKDIQDSQNSQEQSDSKIYNNLRGIPTTVNSNKILILAPFAWQNYSNYTSVYETIYNKLDATHVYDIKLKALKAPGDIEIKDIDTHLVSDETVVEAERIWGTDAVKAKVVVIYRAAEVSIGRAEFTSAKEFAEMLCYFSTELSKKYPTTYPYIEFTEDDIKINLWDHMEIKKTGERSYSITPGGVTIGVEDFKDLANYGVIYIATHGEPTGIACGIHYNNLSDYPNLYDLTEADTWYFTTVPYVYNDTEYYIEVYALTKEFFNKYPHDFKNSIVYISACNSWSFIESSPFSSAKAYLGYSKFVADDWARDISYYFFLYMIEGYKKPRELFKVTEWNYITDPKTIPQGPMSVQKALETFSQVKETYTGKYKSANPDPIEYPENDPCYKCRDCELKLNGVNLSEEDIYFPVPVNIIVHEEQN